MASAGVNVPGGGDGNPASPTGAECRRRLSPPRASAAASGSSDAGAGPSSSSSRRCGAVPPTSSSDADTVDEGDTEEEAEEGRELPPVAPAAAAREPARQEHPAAAEAWPVAFGSMELAGRMREMEDTISLHPGFFTWVDGTPMHFFAVFDGHGGPHVSPPRHLASERGGLPPTAGAADLPPAFLLVLLPANCC
jgi:protein phosphatase 2C